MHGPKIQLLIDELLQLRIVKDKVDHPRKGSKDLSDAVCGAVYNAIALTPPDADKEVEIYSYDGVFSSEIEELRKESDARLIKNKTIKMPDRPDMPASLRDFLGMHDGDNEDDFSVDSVRII